MKINLGWRIWVLIIILFLSVLSIFGMPPTLLQKGVVITSIDSNSTAFEQGLRRGQIITGIDGKEVRDLSEFSLIMSSKFNSNQSEKIIFQIGNSEIILFSNKTLEITVSEISKTNLKLGLDLEGGSRALVKAQDFELSPEDAEELSDVIETRLNVYGIEDINVVPIFDLVGDNFVRIEIAGATPQDLRNLISEQGKFEAKIGNETVFVGGNKDITSVARSGQEALIETCQPTQGGYFCNFRFTIFLSEDAARRHAKITGDLGISLDNPGYLSERLDLYLDDKLVTSLLISEGLKGVLTTQISISGSEIGETQNQAYDNAIDEMNQLQTVLITGSLPYKLEILKLDTLSPTLGKQFINSILFAGVAALFAVFLIISFKYKNIKLSMAFLITSLSEIIIILGIASLIKWNLDLPSIAGILVTIGTGIDQQIIILDEARDKFLSIKQRMKRAFGIILGAYFTAVVAMLPLYWAAAGFFKGFAITTIIGITAGILITRPAFTEMVRRIEE